MSWKLRIYAGVGQWLRFRGVDAKQVIDINEEATSVGIRTRIIFLDRNLTKDHHDFAGPLSDIINGIA